MEKKRKSKIWVAIAGLGICFSFIGALAVEVLQNKKKTDSRMIDLSKEIPEDKRLLGILYTENKEKILEHKNNLRVILGTSKSDTKIESKEVTMEFNKNNPSVTITAKSDSKVVRGSVEIKFKKPDISSRVKDEDRDLGVFNVIDEQKVVDRIIERDILNVKKFYDDLNYEKFSEKFEININQQSRIVTIKAKDDSIYYSGQIDFRYQSPEFDTIGGIVKEVNELVDTQANTVLTRFYELNQSLFSQENVQITRDQLQVVVTQNTAKITLTGNKNYQGSITINLTVKKQFDTIQNLQKDINQLVDTNSTNVLNRFFELNQQTLKPFNITKNNLKVIVENNTATVSIQNHTDYQGSITINLSVIPQFSTLRNLNRNVDQLTDNSSNTVLNRFMELNKTSFERENVQITRDQLQVVVTQNTAKITLTGNKNYQGSVEVNLTVKKQFDTIQNLQKDINQLVDTNSTNVLNRFFELNQQTLKPFNITKNNLKVIVENNTGTVSIQNHTDYQGSITINLSVIPQFSTLSGLKTNVDQLTDNSSNTVLNRFMELNKTLFAQENVQITRDQLQVVVTQNTAKITLTGNKNYQGSITINLTVKKQFDTIQNLQKDINQLVDTNSQTVLNRFFELNQQTLKPFNITKNNLKVIVSNNTATVSIQNHTDYQGSITINLSVIPQFSTLRNLNRNVDQLTDNSSNTVLDRFIQLNQTLFAQENVKITRDQLQVQVNDNTAKITLIGNKNYQGSITINLTVKKQFDTIQNLQKDINQLVDTNSSTVLNRFFELNQQILKPFNITKNNLKVVVSNNTATVSIQNHTDYQGSITINLSVIPQFSTLRNLNRNVDQLTDNSSNTVLNRFMELNKTLFAQENVQITRDQLQVVVTQNTAKITLTGNKNYQGSVEVNLTVKKQFDTIRNLNTNINQLINEEPSTVLNRFYELNEQVLKPLNITKNKLKLEVNINNTTIRTTITVINHANYQGSVQVNLSVIPQFSTLRNLNRNVDQLTNNSVDTVLDRFIQLNQTLFAQENVKITRDQLQVEVSGNTAKITLTGNKNYQGSITINLTVKNQFSSISGIVKEVNNLKNNDQQSVLNRFILLNSTRLNLHKITRSQLKVVVNDNVATITVINHPSYQGSIQVNLKSWLKVTKSYLGVLDNDGRESISSSVLRALNIQNNWNFSLNDLNIDVNGKDARIRGKAGKNKYFIGEINVEFGLTNLYDRDGGFIVSYYDLERIGFFKNIEGEWQIMNIEPVTGVPEVLPSFITSLKDAFKTNSTNYFTYKGVEKWNTSKVTDMSGMFENARGFNIDISNWDTSNVTNMSRMFQGAERFNQNINSWDTSNVTDMSRMFERAKEFDRPLNSWDTSKVTNMSRMFAFAENFDHYIGDWDVSKVRDMSFMFYSATKYARYIGRWNLSSIQNFVSFGTGSQYAKTTFFRLFHIIPTILYNHLNISFYKQPIPE
ncbi:BspA family leucine-rich repeat surface protein [Mycoplasma yeatsii]|uniref:Surface protein n=1 Tax=Mycoplasma yeatsii TaxID=51365 RepID=A0ABU0NEY9_9MOLU|nr:BspA family leucine-rich repeat surface protein [Mycoplasma yeatsii]MDQ0568001.1 surface protein [Mycoplasma yeatsii]